MMEALAKKYIRETGLEPTYRRLARAMAFCRKYGLQPREVRFENHIDPRWASWDKRTAAERLSVDLGHTNATKRYGPASRWWIVPKRLPKKAA